MAPEDLTRGRGEESRARRLGRPQRQLGKDNDSTHLVLKGDYSLVLRFLVLQLFSPTASSPTSSSPTHFSFFHSTVLQPNSPTPTGPTSCYFTILISRIYKSCVHMYTTSKPIELESPGCTGFEASQTTDRQTDADSSRLKTEKKDNVNFLSSIFT